MQAIVVVGLIVLVVAVIAWTWWSKRSGHDPMSSVDHFHRALSAMSPPAQRSAGPASEHDEVERSKAPASNVEASGDQRVRVGEPHDP